MLHLTSIHSWSELQHISNVRESNKYILNSKVRLIHLDHWHGTIQLSSLDFKKSPSSRTKAEKQICSDDIHPFTNPGAAVWYILFTDQNNWTFNQCKFSWCGVFFFISQNLKGWGFFSQSIPSLHLTRVIGSYRAGKSLSGLHQNFLMKMISM